MYSDLRTFWERQHIQTSENVDFGGCSTTRGEVVGMEVIDLGRRSPYFSSGGQCYWKGVILSPWDPRSWKDSLAFTGLPTESQVAKHIDRIHEIERDVMGREFPGFETVPVLWDFADHGEKLYWEKVENLRAAWQYPTLKDFEEERARR